MTIIINNIKDYYSIPDQPNKNNQPQVPNYQRFDIIKPNLPAFQTFATLTHTIGNFTVLPYWINTARNNFSKDYWDITLLSLQEWLAPTTPTSKAWINFVEMFYLQPRTIKPSCSGRIMAIVTKIYIQTNKIFLFF